MLKFLRKYQLFIMIIGGSLLMVVFLLEPVITRLAPTADKQTVANIGPDAQKVSAFDREIANAQYSAVRNVAPVIVSPYFIGLDNNSPGEHWLLLAREAEANGLVGEAGEGVNWLPQLAQIVAQSEARLGIMQQFANIPNISPDIIDMFLRQPQAQQGIADRTNQLQTELPNLVLRATGANPYLKTTDDTYRALATARGILRLLAYHRTAARRSIPESSVVLNNAFDGIAADLLLLTPELITGTLAQPTEQDLQNHFDRFKDLLPADSDLGIGYVLPPRVKLEYLKLDAQTIADAITVDRVEITKRFRRNSTLYGASLDAKSISDQTITVAKQIENEIRANLTQSVMVDADRAIRGAMLAATRGLDTNDDGTLETPEGWVSPTLESIAQTVSQTVTLPNGDPAPLPEVTRHASSWLTSTDVAALEGFGSTSFRIGASGYPATAVPFVIARYLDEGILDELLPIEIGIPYVASAATDAQNNRYYLNVFEARPQSAAENIDEAGRETVEDDYAQVEAYDVLTIAADGYLDVARTSDLDGLAAQFSETAPPQTAQNIIIRSPQRSTIGFPAWANSVNTQDVRDQVLQTARERLEPLQSYDQIDPIDAYLAVEIPNARVLAIFKFISRRPMTTQQSRFQGSTILQQEISTELTSVEDFIDKFPYSFTAMKRRHQYVPVVRGGSQAPTEAPTPEDDASEPTETDETTNTADS